MTGLYNYDTYLKTAVQPVIPIEVCAEIYNALIRNIDIRDEIAMELWEEQLAKCFRYQEMRMNWALYSREEKMEKDSLRTSIHDSVIIGFNMLSRYMEQNGLPTEWRCRLGENRKCIGDFACYISYIYSINNR